MKKQSFWRYNLSVKQDKGSGMIKLREDGKLETNIVKCWTKLKQDKRCFVCVVSC